jgi:YD repeat-containing protein
LRSIGAGGQTTTYAYERNDNLKSVTDPRGKLYGYSYDAINRLIQELDPNGAAVKYTLDKRGVTTAYTDPRNLATSYVYNGFRELIRQTSPDSGTTVHVRDKRGLITQSTDGRGIVSVMTYDNIGRLLSKAYPAAPAETVRHTYDTFVAGSNFGRGRVSRITSESAVIDRQRRRRGGLYRRLCLDLDRDNSMPNAPIIGRSGRLRNVLSLRHDDQTHKYAPLVSSAFGRTVNSASAAPYGCPRSWVTDIARPAAQPVRQCPGGAGVDHWRAVLSWRGDTIDVHQYQ